MLRELLKYVPVVPLVCALLLFALMPFENAPSDRANRPVDGERHEGASSR